MDKNEIKSVWAAFLEVQESKKKKLDPVGKEDGDVDNDGDEDSSDEYLANRRKAIGKSMKKEESEESPYPSLDKKKREKKGSNLEPANTPSDKLKGESVEEATKGKGKKDPKDPHGHKKAAANPLNLNPNKTTKVKTYEGKEEDEVECPKCKGKGCGHCDDKGYHMKEDYEYFVESLDDEELDEYIDWLMEDEEQLDELSKQTYRNARDKAIGQQKGLEFHGKDKEAAKRERQAGKFQTAYVRKRAQESTNMDRYVEALRSIPNDQIDKLDELSSDLLNRAADAASKKSTMLRNQQRKRQTHNNNKVAGGRSFVMGKRKDHHDSNERKAKQLGARADKKIHQSVKFSSAAGNKRIAQATAKKAQEAYDLDELSKQTYASARDKAISKQKGLEFHGKNKEAAKRERQAGKFQTAYVRKEAYDIINSVLEMRQRERLEVFEEDYMNSNQHPMDRSDAHHTQASYHSQQAAKAKKAGDNVAHGQHKNAARHHTAAGDAWERHHQKRQKGMHVDPPHGKSKVAHSSTQNAHGQNEQVVQRQRLESVLSPYELAALEEKAKHVGTKGPAPSAPEEFMSTSSPKDKKIYKDHEAGSDKKLEDYEEMGEMDAVKAGKGGPGQAPARRGEKRASEPMHKVQKARGQ